VVRLWPHGFNIARNPGAARVDRAPDLMREADHRIEGTGRQSAGYRMVIVPAAPEIFTKPDGSGAVLNQDGSLNSASSPARAGQIVTIWATGTGAPAENEDTIAQSAAGRFCCTVVVDAQAATVAYSGPSPGLTVAATQLNTRWPGMLAGGGTSSLEIVTAGRRSIPVRLFTAP